MPGRRANDNTAFAVKHETWGYIIFIFNGPWHEMSQPCVIEPGGQDAHAKFRHSSRVANITATEHAPRRVASRRVTDINRSQRMFAKDAALCTLHCNSIAVLSLRHRREGEARRAQDTLERDA